MTFGPLLRVLAGSVHTLNITRIREYRMGCDGFYRLSTDNDNMDPRHPSPGAYGLTLIWTNPKPPPAFPPAG
jgi:hypothetical protein